MRTLHGVASLLALGLAVLSTATCNDFPDAPVKGDESRFSAEIRPKQWSDTLKLGEVSTYSVEVVDRMGRVVADPSLNWMVAGQLTAGQTNADSTTLEGRSLGPAPVQVQLADGRFQDAVFQDTVTIMLAGVAVAAPSADTTLTALSDTVTLVGAGLDVNGMAVANVPVQFDTVGLRALRVVYASLDTLRLVADAAGVDTITVMQDQCVGICEGRVVVTVRQTPATVALALPQDTLLAGDTIQAAATAQDRNGFDVASAAYGWTSSDPAVVTVDASGRIIAKAEGTAYVKAEANGAADSTAVRVTSSGRLLVQLADAPADYYQRAWLYTSGVYVVDNMINHGRRYLSQTPRAIDLLTLQDGVLDTLGIGNVPAATYSNLFLLVDSTAVELKSGYRFSDGNTRSVLLPPAAGRDSLAVPVALGVVVNANDSLAVVVEFDVNRNFPMSAEPVAGVVDPVSFTATTRSIDQANAGTISGTLTTADTLSAAYRTIRAVRTDVAGDTLTARTRADGTYTLRYVTPGTYDLSLTSRFQCYAPAPVSQSVGVAAGAATAGANFALNAVVPDSVVMTVSRDTLNALNDSTTFAAAAYGGGTQIQGIGIVWSTSDASVVTVNSEGRVVSKGVGTASIMASLCGTADTMAVTVRQVPAGLHLTPTSVAVDAGDTVRVNAVVVDSSGVAIPGEPVTWSSNDTTVATVDGQGLVKGVAGGTTTLTVSAGGFTASPSVAVTIHGLIFQRVTIAGTTACDINGSGAAFCWGDNSSGTFGDGSYTASNTPVSVGAGTSFASIDQSMNDGHACGVTVTGDAYCWGNGGSGQLGNNSYSSSATPVLVSGGYTWIQVEVGTGFSCGITVGGDAYCWGYNADGRLGNGSLDYSYVLTPGLVMGAHKWRQLSLGDAHACGLATDDYIYCWGFGSSGQIGDDTWQDQAQPTRILTTLTFKAVTAGEQYACGIASNGGAYCWGDNSGWQLGSSNGTNAGHPIAVQGALSYAKLAAGQQHTCGITTSGLTVCWGQNWDGRLGDGTTSANASPRIVQGGATFESIAAGRENTCAMTTGGQTYCWGDNGSGQLGNGVASKSNVPVDVGLPFSVQQAGLSVGEYDHVCAVSSTGKPYCWGGNASGQLGDGTTTDSPYPVAVQTAQSFSSVSAGGSHSCGLTSTGDAYCWGMNWAGELGDSTYLDRNTPARVAGGHTWSQISAGGDNFTCGITTSGALYCWGLNSNSQAAQPNTYQNYNTPQLVDDTHAWAEVGAGFDHACALTDAGEAYCWGTDSNGTGVLGSNTYYNTQTVPMLVAGGYTFTAISVGQQHVCAIADTQAGYCWGQGNNGELGNGSWTSSPTPVRVGALLFTEISAAGSSSCGVTTDNTDVCWGGNWSGQLGTGDFSAANAPLMVSTATPITSISGGNDTVCGLASDGTTYCWGNRGPEGRFGDGATAAARTPVPVINH